MIDISMNSFSNEVVKIAAAASRVGKVLDFIKKYKRPLGITGLIGGGYVGGKTIEGVGKDYMLGRRVRKQYEERGG